jgi:hypothetical protein
MRNRSAAFVLILLLAACSGGSDTLNFTTEGVTAPAASCDANPQSFAVAEPLGSYGDGICMVRNAYRLTRLNEVNFSQPAIINCAVANGVNTWMQNIAQPAAQAAYGSRIVAIDVAASYACRPRNGVRGAKLSEHGFGNAIDVSGFTFADGRHLSVENDYYSSAFLKQVRSEACGIFHTVLGPGSDSSHRDHLHFDLANRRSGENFCH